ncbi:MAG: GTP cyclohydrolase II, partial [Tumebacillaceae bacterium]
MMNATSKAYEVVKERVQRIEKEGTQLFLVGPIQLPVSLNGETVVFHWYSWLSGADLPYDDETLLQQLPLRNLAEHQQSSVLVYGDFAESKEAVIRMHSICHTGDIFGSKRCDCGYQLKQSMSQIVESGSGALFYLANHEGRGIGLFSKALTYLLQEQGLDTVEANLALGFQDDERSYEEALLVLQQLRQKPVTLLTNNPNKLRALRAAGLRDTRHVNLWGDVSPFNRKYLN